MPDQHNHVTRDIKPPGECPGCDEYHRSQDVAESLNGGELSNRGESHFTQQAVDSAVDAAQRAVLTQQLTDAGHDGCASDLQNAAEPDVARVAYEIAEHVEEACGDIDADPDLAGRIRAWADAHEAMPPSVPRKRTIPVFTRRDGNVLVVDIKSDDILDLANQDEGVMVVTVVIEGAHLFSFERIGPLDGGDN